MCYLITITGRKLYRAGLPAYTSMFVYTIHNHMCALRPIHPSMRNVCCVHCIYMLRNLFGPNNNNM